MTNNEIIKALKCCSESSCEGCPYEKESSNLFDISCVIQMSKDTLNLINRQKALIDVLREINSDITEAGQEWQKRYKTARAEARKEFAERIIKKYCIDEYSYFEIKSDVFVNGIRHLVKEIETECEKQ